MNEIYEKLLRKPIAAVVSALIFLLAIVTAAPYFGYHPLEGSGILGIMLLVLSSLVMGLAYALVEIVRVQTEEFASTRTLAEAVIREVEKRNDRHEYHSATTLAQSMSRPFWLEGKYRDRIRLGELLFQAASSIEPPDLSACAEALIDDLGWTNVELNNLDEAKRRISEGIDYARRANDAYLIAKGYRHLAGVAHKEGDSVGAEEKLKLAEDEANTISDERRKKEMLAGIVCGRGELYLGTNVRKQAELAKECFLRAKVIFEEIGDRERVVKIYCRLGQAFAKMGDIPQAYEAYNLGRERAHNLGWQKQICEIDLLLGQLMLDDHRVDDATKKVTEARDISKYLGLTNLYERATEILDRLNSMKKRPRT